MPRAGTPAVQHSRLEHRPGHEQHAGGEEGGGKEQEAAQAQPGDVQLVTDLCEVQQRVGEGKGAQHQHADARQPKGCREGKAQGRWMARLRRCASAQRLRGTLSQGGQGDGKAAPSVSNSGCGRCIGHAWIRLLPVPSVDERWCLFHANGRPCRPLLFCCRAPYDTAMSASEAQWCSTMSRPSPRPYRNTGCRGRWGAPQVIS